MGRSLRRSRQFRSRCARFEPLEPRHYLSVNLPLTTNPGVQQMPSIAVDPIDDKHLVVAYMDYALVGTGYAGIGVAVSTDGGVSWQNSSLDLPAGFDQGAANPVVQFDTIDHDPKRPGIQNRVYVSYMAATFLGAKPPITNPSGTISRDDLTQFRSYGMSANNGIFVSASDDGGIEWHDPVTVASHTFDGQHRVPFDIMPDLAVDTYRYLPESTTPNPNFGNLYAVWSRYYPDGQYPGESNSHGGSNIMFSVSRDGGATWQLQLESHPDESNDPITVLYTQGYFYGDFAEGSGLENWSHVTVGPGGDIYVSQFLGAQFAVHHSKNAGASFAHPDASTNALFPFGNNVPAVPGVLSNNSFRVQSVRSIVADPKMPGHVYVVETKPAVDPQGNKLDEDEIIFARSEDYGRTWQRTFTVGANSAANVLNDENDGRSATGEADDVTAAQFLPKIVADATGKIAVIWYDVRRDALEHEIDVFGTISLDGGKTFSPNFRVTDRSFDADDGKFTDARGNPTFYLGDFLGLALGGGTAFAVWADTRSGNQDILFSSFTLDPPPLPLNDRYEENDSRETATILARVIELDLPKLALVYGEEDWFKFETGSTGPLSISATLAAAGPNVRLELYNLQDGNLHLVAAGTENGLATSVSLSSSASATYWVRVLSGDDAQLNTSVRYTLSIKSLTDNLGTRAYGAVPGQTLEIGDDFHYALTSAAAGAFHVALTRAANSAGEIHLELLDPATLDVIAEGTLVGNELVADAAVARGQKVYVHVYGDEDSRGSFGLSFRNLDQFTLEDISTVFYPTGLGPSESALADLNGDGAVDIVVSHVGQNILSVLMNNGDGTYQAPRELTIGAFQQGGPFTLQGIQNFHRDLAVANFNPPGPGRSGDNFLDIVVVNSSSSDISVFLGNGDGTFQPQRRFDATAAPYAMAVGDLNNDSIPDVVVIDSTDSPTAQGAVLLSRGDGTFQLPKTFSLPDREPNRTNSILIVDVNRDGKNDLVERDFFGTTVFLGNGDGTFQLSAESIIGASGPGLAVADLDSDGDLDVVTTQNNTSLVVYVLQNPDATFESEPRSQEVGQFPVAVQVVDVASVIEVEGNKVAVFGTPDGLPDLVVANNGYTLPTLSGPANVVVMAGLRDNDVFAGFTDPVEIAPAKGPLDVKVADANHDGVQDVVMLDRDGVLIAFGKKPIIAPNNTTATARGLGTVVHTIQPTLTIVPGNTEDYYKLTVPTEAFTGARDQVLDFSAGFAYEEGAGLMMQILDADGNVLAAGDRVRVVATQGEELFVRIFAAGTDAAGAYTLIVNTLPQVAAIESESLLPGIGGLPGGPTTRLVVVFQGDRLNVAAAENTENYSVLWLGPDGVRGGGDDRPITIGAGLSQDAKRVLYNPSRNNVDAASGRSIPTALRQTVTLLFGEPLPEGNYLIEVDTAVMSSTFNLEELGLLSPAAGFNGHPVVSIVGGQVTEGVSQTRQNLVRPTGALGNLNALEDGTNFLTQSHNDLSALLDSLLTALGDDPDITARLLQQIIAIVLPGLLGPSGEPIVPLAVVLVDPTSIGLVAPDGASLTHDLRTNTLTSNLPQTFIEVGGNLELIVIANAVGNYELNLANVPPRARAGVVYFGRQGAEHDTFTDALRAKTLATTFVADSFSLNVRYTASIVAEAADTATTFVAFVAPQLVTRSITTSVIASTQSKSSVAPSLLLSVVNRSRNSLSGNNLLKTFGSGGSLTRSLFRAAEEVWELVFSGWDPVRQLMGDTQLGDQSLEDSDDRDGQDSKLEEALERAWESFGEIIDDILAPSESADSGHSDRPQPSKSTISTIEGQPAQSPSVPSNDSQSSAGPHGPATETEPPFAPSSNPALPASETSDASPVSTEGLTHATAA